MAVTLDNDVGQRVALYDKNGNAIVITGGGIPIGNFDTARALAAGLSIPTTADVLAWVIGQNAALTGDPIITTTGGSSAGASTRAGLLLSSPVIFDSSAHLPIYSARQLGDNTTGANIPGASVFDSNGTNWDRHRNNISSTYLASAARVATPSVSDVTTYNARGIIAWVNVTVSGGGTHGITLTVDEKDSVSGVYKTVLTSAEIAAPGLFRFVVFPGVTLAANVAVSDVLSRTLRILPTHSDATSNTYSVSYDLIV